MITIQESQELITRFVALRGTAEETKTASDLATFRKHERLCIEKFKYLITMHTNWYRSFANYEDLNQEGMLALVKSMKTFKLNKGLFFYWAHQYIGTRVSRCANLHTAIRYPLKVAKVIVPHRESILPLLIEEKYCPDLQVESSQNIRAVETAMSTLRPEQIDLLNLAFGFDGEKPLSINKICKRLGISRANCNRLIDDALSIVKNKIKL